MVLKSKYNNFRILLKYHTCLGQTYYNWENKSKQSKHQINSTKMFNSVKIPNNDPLKVSLSNKISLFLSGHPSMWSPLHSNHNQVSPLYLTKVTLIITFMRTNNDISTQLSQYWCREHYKHLMEIKTWGTYLKRIHWKRWRLGNSRNKNIGKFLKIRLQARQGNERRRKRIEGMEKIDSRKTSEDIIENKIK